MTLPLNRPPIHPGEYLADFLEDYGLSQQAFADHLSHGWTQPKLNEILRGKRSVTPRSALAFADAFGNSPEFWLNAQRNWDLWHALKEHPKTSRLQKTG